MHRALLGLAAFSALLTVSTPSSARDRAYGNRNAATVRFRASPGSGGDLCGSNRPRGRDVCRSGVAMDWYGGEWALYNNRGWAPDSYNDWWHDRPDRAYPAWMRRNQDCQRQWFSGDVLKC